MVFSGSWLIDFCRSEQPLSTLWRTLWRNGDSLLSDIYLLKKGNVKLVKSSFKSCNLCKFTAWCPDVLADKPHPRFDTKIFEQKSAAYTPVFMVDSASYLGITVSSKLKWSEDISSISSKASWSLGLIKRNLFLELPLESTWNGLYQYCRTQTGVCKWFVGLALRKRYFNPGESSKKSCSFLPSKLQSNSKCDRHVILSEMGHIRNKTKEKQIDSDVQNLVIT